MVPSFRRGAFPMLISNSVEWPLGASRFLNEAPIGHVAHGQTQNPRGEIHVAPFADRSDVELVECDLRSLSGSHPATFGDCSVLTENAVSHRLQTSNEWMMTVGVFSFAGACDVTVRGSTLSGSLFGLRPTHRSSARTDRLQGLLALAFQGGTRT